MASAKRKLEVVITGDSRNLERAFGRSAKASETFGRRITRGAGKGMLFLGKGAAAAAVVGVAAVGVSLVKAGKAAADAEASNARLTAQLKSMGRNNAQVRGQIEQTVQSLSKLGAFDDEDLQDAFTTLVRSSGNVAKSQKDLALVADVARGAQLDLGTAAKLVNRVNAGNIGSLKRYGIALEEGATKEEALAALRAKFGGQAAAYANTAAGAQEAFAVATENAFEQIGIALTPLIIEFSKFAQDVLPKVAAAVSVYLGKAIAWIKTNWPEIRAVLVTVFTALKTVFTQVVVPVAKGIITALAATVSFVRQNMPVIKATAQAVFGWLQANVIPTMRTIGRVVATVVGAMAYVWREHGTTIKRILTPVYNTFKTIITSALIIIRESVEFWLALIRGDWGKAFGSLKTIARTALDAVIAILTMYPRMAFEAARTIGVRMVEGVKAGLASMYGEIKAYLERQIRSIVNNLNPFSPVEHGGQLIADRLSDGIIRGLRDRRGDVSGALTATVRDAVQSARGNLAGLTGGLAGMLGTLFGANSAEGKRLREIRAQQKREDAAREKARLEAAVASAETDQDRAQAQQDLNDWLLEQEAQSLEEAIANKQTQYENDIANLTTSFNNGVISAEQFRDSLSAIVGGQTGAELGAAFASEFGQHLRSIAAQVQELIGFTGVGAGAGAVSPAGTAFDEQMSAWENRKRELEDALRDARQDAKAEKSPGKSKITKAEQERIDKAKAALDAHNKNRPRRMAMGGVLRRPVLAGEAGPEAVLPLSSGRAQRMLASAIDGVDRAGGRRATVINVTVNGNEFSARDFARKLQPELERLVGFGQV